MEWKRVAEQNRIILISHKPQCFKMIDEEIVFGTDCSGLGSIEVAAERIGMKHSIAFACDKDKYAKASYLANHKPGIFYDDLVTRDNSCTPKVDIYCSGFPCQTFSMAGNRRGFEDTRGTIFFNNLEYVAINRPRVVFFENVKGLLSHDKVKGSKSKYGRTFGVIRDSIALTVNGQHNLYKYDDCVNYHLHFFVLNSKSFGIPQNRERIFMVAFRDESDSIRFKKPKEFKLEKCLLDLLEQEIDERYFLSEKMIDGLIFKNKGNQIGYINQDTQASKVIDANGIMDTLCAGSHGYANGYILIAEATKKGFAIAKEGDSINLSNINSKTRRGRVGEGIANTLDTTCNQAVYVSKEVRTDEAKSIRKESQKNGTDFSPRRAKEVIFEDKQFVNTITTGQTRDNLILLLDATHSSNRVYDAKGIASTQKANGGGGGAKTGIYLINERIRRLTPKEAFRLMGYDDVFYEMCKALNSDTQLYKQAGNSIVVDTIMWLLIEVCKALKIPYKLPERYVS